MTDYYDLMRFFRDQNMKIIIAADAETRVHEKRGDQMVLRSPAGGVSVAMDSIARAANATYIGVAKTKEDREFVEAQKSDKVKIDGEDGSYQLKRLFFTQEELDAYYFGFANQTLWPICHVAFERPIFNKEWYEGYKAVNKKFADAIRSEIKGKTFIWINDYQLSLVPLFLNKPKDTIIGFFWHIPWPTHEIFRVLPNKRDILWSMLSCDFLAFHRGYQARNFIETVEQEFEVRIDRETNTVFFNNQALTVKDLPMGIDTDVIKHLVGVQSDESFWGDIARRVLGLNDEQKKEEKRPMDLLFEKYRVIFGVDRLDYTKGVPQRLEAIDAFFTQNPQYKEKAIYFGILAPSRDKIPSYRALREHVEELANNINKKHQTSTWKPIELVYKSFTREDVMMFFSKADVCLVTPLDDGMNLVSKEFAVAASISEDPGMLVLSRFAGSAIDLTDALIVNPYDADETARAIKRGLEMDKSEKKTRLTEMVNRLDEHNIYEWALQFLKNSMHASRNRHSDK